MPSWANKRKRPNNRGAPKLHPVTSSGGELGRLDLQDFAGAHDRDRPRLHRLWDLADQVDVQEPVLQARTLDLHMVRELEATFEVPRGDALVEHVATFLLVVGLLLASERQRVLLCFDREISVGEAGGRDRNAIVVLAGPRDIVGWIAGCRRFHAADLVEHGEQPVEANGLTIVGSKIK